MSDPSHPDSNNFMPSTAPTIYINPRFRNAHINPNFLPRIMLPPAPQPTNIHINPLFLPAPPIQPVIVPAIHPVVAQPSPHAPPKATIISKTNRKLVRQPIVAPVRAEVKSPPNSNAPQLVRIGKRKLVRKETNSTSVPLGNRNSIETFQKKKSSPVAVRNPNAYKIDRRVSGSGVGIKRSSSVAHRGGHHLNENLLSIRVIADRSLVRIGTTPQKSVTMRPSAVRPSSFNNNKKLALVNINGVFYKSTSNKLHRHTVQTSSAIKPVALERSLTVRGAKYHVDKGGKRLRRISEATTSSSTPPSTSLHRIHIGGMTYTEVAPNTFERTDNHRTRVHLTSAKQKSINVLLSRNRTKNNVPCAIYRRLGKCQALERGRCSKVHDPERVAICPKFLQGSCPLDECLLSHNVTLSKMPTCKFFLAKICVRPNCPYLHKKLNEKTEICAQFVAGFCKEAEKCSKRHEFLCPVFESKGVCDQIRCKLPHRAKEVKAPKEAPAKPEVDVLPTAETKSTLLSDRYFDGGSSTTVSDAARGRIQRLLATHRAKSTQKADPGVDSSTEDDDGVQQLIPSRPRLGTLPSFIPIE